MLSQEPTNLKIRYIKIVCIAVSISAFAFYIMMETVPMSDIARQAHDEIIREYLRIDNCEEILEREQEHQEYKPSMLDTRWYKNSWNERQLILDSMIKTLCNNN